MPVPLIIRKSSADLTCRQDVEIVERKGKGHPDTICDAIAEHISIELSKAYKETFGRILHHNIDKGLLVAGRVDCRLGGGKVLEPMRVIIGDRATFRVGRKTLPVGEIAIETAKTWFKQHLPHIDPVRHIRYQVELKPASSELGAIFSEKGSLLGANDTSAAVGYAPFTPTEQLVYTTEQFLNGPQFKRQFPDSGEDVKVMAVRVRQEISLTVAMPLLASAIKSEKAYFERKRQILRNLRKFIRNQCHGRPLRVRVQLNALDSPGKGIEGMYLTLLGTSAEQGDSGQVGRGNRVCGLIPLTRPVSGEAAAGKNPVSHVGKIYNVLAHELAKQIHSRVPKVQEATVWLSSRIGRPVNHPAIAAVTVNLEKGTPLQHVQPMIADIMQTGLENLRSFCDELSEGRYPVF